VARTFLELVEKDQIGSVTLVIERAVSESFEADGARMTGDEVRRRFCICERLIRRLRFDLGWGLQRVLDHLPHYLRCELEGQHWEPDSRTIWMPADGS
jgi:hypothetical protein